MKAENVELIRAQLLESARAYSSIAEWSEELTELAKREADRAKEATLSKQ